MTNAELSKAIKTHLLPSLGQEYVIKGNRLFKTPVKDILLGFCFERSPRDKNGFYVWAFAQPLYIPSEDLDLTFGKRLARNVANDWWEISEGGIAQTFNDLAAVIKKDGLAYLDLISDPSKFCDFFKKSNDLSLRVVEAIVYSEFHSRTKEAEEDARNFVHQLQKKEDLSIPWVQEILENVNKLINAKNESEEKVKEILQRWQRETSKHLGV